MTYDDFRSAVAAARPRWGVVLGSGLGDVPHGMIERASVSFGDVPGMSATTVHGHSGRLVLGELHGRPLLVFRGRLHVYEGHAWDRIAAIPKRAAELGLTSLLLTNAAGGIHDELNPGDLMLLSGHRFLQEPDGWRNPIAAPYSQDINGIVIENERQRGRKLLSGVYAALTGPCYETPAEIRALRSMECDAVGMSTAFEAATAAQVGLQVVAISCITNKAAGLVPGILDHADVLEVARKPAVRIGEIIGDLLRNA